MSSSDTVPISSPFCLRNNYNFGLAFKRRWPRIWEVAQSMRRQKVNARRLKYKPLPKSVDASWRKNSLCFSSPKSNTRISWLRVMSSSDSVWFVETLLRLLPKDSIESLPYSQTAWGENTFGIVIICSSRARRTDKTRITKIKTVKFLKTRTLLC